MALAIDSIVPPALRKYIYVRGFASRQCLILERYINIGDYQVQTPEPIQEAIGFFHTILGSSAGTTQFDTEVVDSNLLEEVLESMREKRLVPPERCEVRAFCDFAISTLETLASVPTKVPMQSKQELHDCFCTMEEVLDHSIVRKRTSVSEYSLHL